MILTGLLGSAGAVWADDRSEALNAYQRGDYSLALQIVLPRAKRGEAWAQSSLGVLYKTGKGVTQDGSEAVKWFRKAADQEHAEAQHKLGRMYLNGEGFQGSDEMV